MAWEPSSFLVARSYGPEELSGYQYRGLGLFQCRKPSPKGRRPAEWSLTHLGSGLRICIVRGDVKAAFPIAKEIADLGDWDFDGGDGWKNRFPNAPELMQAIAKKHGRQVQVGTGQNFDNARDDVVREIVTARAR